MASWLQQLGLGSPSPTLTPKSSKKTDWGELLQLSNDGYYRGDGGDWDNGPQLGGAYGGAGLIFLGRDYDEWGGGDAGPAQTGSSWGRIDPYLLQESQYGSWKNLRGDFENKLNEVANYSADALEQMNAIYDELNKSKGWTRGAGSYSTPFSWSPGSGDHDTVDSNRASLLASLQAQAQGRQKYDNLVSQFNSIYTGAKESHYQREREHQERLAELERQRQAAEAAAARHRAWQSNMPLQNRQNDNLPDTITSGTADSVDGGSDVGGDVGGKPRRRRGSLSSNLGINV